MGRVGGPGRREVGHGNLAERSLIPLLPKEDNFPYSMRVESLITESCGSSSMASVCGGSLAMMDAGVPIERVVAGVAMGLLLDEDGGQDEPIILTDILGLEDALGTMDLKVRGGGFPGVFWTRASRAPINIRSRHGGGRAGYSANLRWLAIAMASPLSRWT